MSTNAARRILGSVVRRAASPRRPPHAERVSARRRSRSARPNASASRWRPCIPRRPWRPAGSTVLGRTVSFSLALERPACSHPAPAPPCPWLGTAAPTVGLGGHEAHRSPRGVSRPLLPSPAPGRTAVVPHSGFANGNQQAWGPSRTHRLRTAWVSESRDRARDGHARRPNPPSSIAQPIPPGLDSARGATELPVRASQPPGA